MPNLGDLLLDGDAEAPGSPFAAALALEAGQARFKRREEAPERKLEGKGGETGSYV